MSRIAHALAKGHEAVAVPNSVIIMVVQDGETNVYDQEVRAQISYCCEIHHCTLGALEHCR